ncbi:hypothetical protein NLJ89_g10596 [Agrocybe chaxingu]|uniref:Uncharacterized protein n=1 Tax=Agrocybe chaxingu TaxID=84603 RepID=A0A9W8JNK2_9AGAR|nr:hypothetical protein NLJ89_g10596 [Agrocybe chaxingu]
MVLKHEDVPLPAPRSQPIARERMKKEEVKTEKIEDATEERDGRTAPLMGETSSSSGLPEDEEPAAAAAISANAGAADSTHEMGRPPDEEEDELLGDEEEDELFEDEEPAILAPNPDATGENVNRPTDDGYDSWDDIYVPYENEQAPATAAPTGGANTDLEQGETRHENPSEPPSDEPPVEQADNAEASTAAQGRAGHESDSSHKRRSRTENRVPLAPGEQRLIRPRDTCYETRLYRREKEKRGEILGPDCDLLGLRFAAAREAEEKAKEEARKRLRRR